MIKAIGFDLGDTLIYSGQPLGWSKNYRNALERGFIKINKVPTDLDYSVCIEILTKYNTRINPRENEISSAQIFNEIMIKLEINKSEKEILEDNFFDYYLQNNKLFDDTLEVLGDIKECNFKIGILTDVPYGSVKVIEEDIKILGKNIDAIVSSVEKSYRKPNITGYIKLAKKLGIQTNEMIYVGNEEKDIIGANNAGIISVLINRTDKLINYGEKYQFKSLKEMWTTLGQRRI
jgi:putative hydrolase of the HAD superfamily